MKVLLAVLPGMVRDRAPRAAGLLLLGLLFAGPGLWSLREITAGPAAGGPAAAGVRDGLAAGGGPAPLAGLLGLLLTGGAVWLWAGVISAGRRRGHTRMVLCRPVYRPVYRLALHAACAALLVALGLGFTGAARLLAGPAVPVPGPLQVAAASLLTAWCVGGAALLLSAVMRRGDGLATVALVLLAVAVGGGGVAAELHAAARPLLALLPPLESLGAVRQVLLSGGRPAPAPLLRVLAYGAAVTSVAALHAVRASPPAD